MSLCDNCRAFDIQAFKSDGTREYRGRGIPCHAAVLGANAGCNFCILLVDAFLDEYESMASKPLNSWFDLRAVGKALGDDCAEGMGLEGFDIALVDFPLEINGVTDYLGQRRLYFHVAADPGSAAQTSGDVIGPIPQDDPLSEASLEYLRSWLNRCTETHKACARSISGAILNSRDAPLPTRCLLIDGVDQSGDLRYRLEETLGKTGCYLTLSHRWNDDTETSKTTWKNYARRKEGKDLNLPPLFRDTILLAHKLGIPYVWIDSVCIVQDGDDWVTESLKMADYYQNSLLTVAAALEDSSQHGLALSKLPSERMPQLARLPYREKSGRQRGYMYVYKSSTAVPESYKQLLTSSDLLTRGWVFQEWSLSRRIACFASHTSGYRLFVHCQSEMPRNECGDSVASRRNDLNWGQTLAFAANSPLVPWLQWQMAVERFSAAALTKPDKDRTIALAGVAKECREVIRILAQGGAYANERADVTPTRRLSPDDHFVHAYVAGLWVRNLHSDLLWRQSCDRSTVRSRIVGFPTWSWASILVPVIWALDDDKRSLQSSKFMGITTEDGTYHDVNLCESMEADKVSGLEPHPSRAFDVDCMHGILHFSGKLVPVGILGEVTRDEWKQRFNAKLPGLNVSVFSDWRNLFKMQLPSHSPVICGWGSLEHPEFQEYGSDSSDDDTRTIYAFPLTQGETSSSDLGMTFDVFWSVLYLRKVRDQFERVGMGCIFGPDVVRALKAAEERSIVLC
ncbi:unnamed protein product [Parascedosporium putredinis]|uniref:Heterokaryon incompatibility domain-containing protein n=1 Tax=Parascedosporium putredinis TaxID=1442378 RepID=A0A9P1M8S5_9PEZI|nr:unnamed protein product [Parascedosporium putredinis]CAI7993305.1 unnamed protein product [Parascedosporium putredinis]